MNNVSFIIPSSDNLRYLKHAYTSIKLFAKDSEIIILDDASTDGTLEWLFELDDENLLIHKTENKVGHTVLYNVGAKLATRDIITILHADMYIGPNYLENILKHLEEGTVVSATRIEPPLHPPGKEKIIQDFGLWPEEFKKSEFISFVEEEQKKSKDKITKGIFAPWAIYKKDYWAIGGHDELFAPYPYEDSDIFQRFILNGYEIKQSRDALVYHLTCRGHKWTESIGKVHDKFEKYELNARRNWHRKWGVWIENDDYGYPIIHPKYKIGLVLTNIPDGFDLPFDLLWFKEPFFYQIAIDEFTKFKIQGQNVVETYIKQEQPNTSFILDNKFIPYEKMDVDVEVVLDLSKALLKDDFRTLDLISYLLEETECNVGDEFNVYNITIKIKKELTNYVMDNIKCQQKYT